MTEQTEGAEGTIDGVPFTYEQAKIVAAREAAAEVRGAQAVLAAVEGIEPSAREGDLVMQWEAAKREREHLLTAARAAAAVTTSSVKSSDLATRVPQDESQRAAGGGGEA